MAKPKKASGGRARSKASQPAAGKTENVAAAEIAALQRLHPRAAAWLADVALSTFRDRANEIPPAADGTYDGRSVLQWVATRSVPTGALTDGELEPLLRLAEVVASNISPATAMAVVKLRELKQRYGPAGWLVFVETLIQELEAWGDEIADPYIPRSDQELLAKAREAERERRERLTESRLEKIVACEHCGKVRNGRKWVEQELSGDQSAVLDCCPRCDEKHYRQSA